jgi:hypothetical protein
MVGSTSGLVGTTPPAALCFLTGCYYDSVASLQSSSALGSAESTVQLQSGTLPIGFDTSIWIATAGQYPKLKWQTVSASLPTPLTFGARAGGDSSTPADPSAQTALDQVRHPFGPFSFVNLTVANGTQQVPYMTEPSKPAITTPTAQQYNTGSAAATFPVSVGQYDIGGVQISLSFPIFNQHDQNVENKNTACLSTVYAMLADSVEIANANKTGTSPTLTYAEDYINSDGYATPNPRTGTNIVRDNPNQPLMSADGTGVNMAAFNSDLKSITFPSIIGGSANFSGGQEAHFMLAVGLDSSGLIIANDPWTGKQVKISTDTGNVVDNGYNLPSFTANGFVVVKIGEML